MEFVKESQNQNVNMREVEDRLQGWSDILLGKCTKNELYEVQNVNMPQNLASCEE